MKLSRPCQTLLILTGSVAALLIAQTAQAANYYWDGGTTNIGTNGDAASQGGSGTWSTAISNWDVDPAGSPHVAWTSNTAVFGGSTGTVTLGTAISATGLVFQTSGYTIQSGAAAQVLTLTGASIDTGAVGTTTIINAKLTGASVPINGSGTITFGGVDDNSSFSMVVNSGVTAIFAKTSTDSVHVVGGTGVTINSGGLVKLGGTGGDQIYKNASVTLAGGTFDLNGQSESFDKLSGTTGTVDNTAAGVGS